MNCQWSVWKNLYSNCIHLSDPNSNQNETPNWRASLSAGCFVRTAIHYIHREIRMRSRKPAIFMKKKDLGGIPYRAEILELEASPAFLDVNMTTWFLDHSAPFCFLVLTHPSSTWGLQNFTRYNSMYYVDTKFVYLERYEIKFCVYAGPRYQTILYPTTGKTYWLGSFSWDSRNDFL